MQKAHVNIDWENRPSDKTPLNEQNLNKMDRSIDTIDNRVIELDTTKFDKIDAQKLVKSITFSRDNGVFTVTYFDGTTATIDTMLEKLAVNFDYDAVTQKLIITLDDGEVKEINLSALITEYEFLDSGTVAFQLQQDGKIKAVVKEGSIEEKHLRPDYLADIRVEVSKAEASKNAAAQSEANAKISAESAKESEINAAKNEESADKCKREAETAAANAKISEDAAKNSETNAAKSETASKLSEDLAAISAGDAADNADNAATSAVQAKDYSGIAQSYAVGTEGQVRPEDASDNSKSYSELAKKLTDEARKLLEQAQKIIAAASTGALIPAGTVTFEELPEEPQIGYMYNISNNFTTDSRFSEGEGIFYRAGANVYWTSEGKWDVLTGVQVTGVKGDSETEYRVGNVSIGKENIGLGKTENKTSKDILSELTANDVTNALGYIPPKQDTWKANTLSNEGYVEKGEGHADQVWGTDENGNPGWRENKSSIEMLETLEELEANTQSGYVADALAVRDMGLNLQNAVDEINSNLGKLSGWCPYSESFNIGFVNGIADVTVQGKYITSTSVSVCGIWEPNFNGIVRAVGGKIRITGYLGSTAVTGTVWVSLAGIIRYQ